MSTVGIMSDSHDNLPGIKQALELLKERGIEYLIHGGDYVAPFAMKLIGAAGVPVVGIYGNNDGEKAGLRNVASAFGVTIHEPPYEFEFAGRRFLMNHDLASLTIPEGSLPDVVITGHTHEVDIRTEKNVLLINPGECSGWLSGNCSAVVLDSETLTPELIKFPNPCGGTSL